MQFPPRNLPLGLAMFTLVATAPFSFAQTYVGSAYEPFDYSPAGSNLDGTSAGGTGWNATGSGTAGNTTWAGGTSTVASSGTRTIGSGLDYSDANFPLEVGNAGLITGAGSNAQAGRSLGQSVNQGTLYFSFLTQKTSDTLRTLNFSLYSGTAERVSFGQNGGTASTNNTGNFTLLTQSVVGGIGTAGAIYSASSPISYALNTTFLVVGKLEFNFSGGVVDRLTYYINPTSLTDEGSLSPYLVVDNSDLGSITGIRLFGGSSQTGYPGAVGLFDEIRIGSTFSDVVTAVPEPSTWALLVGSAGLAFAVLRKRRQA